MDAETGLVVSADDRGNAGEEGVLDSAPDENKNEWRYRGPLPVVAGEIQYEVITQSGAVAEIEPDGGETSIKDKCKNSRDRSGEKDKKRSRNHWSSESPRKSHAKTRNYNRRKTEARR